MIAVPPRGRGYAPRVTDSASDRDDSTTSAMPNGAIVRDGTARRSSARGALLPILVAGGLLLGVVTAACGGSSGSSADGTDASTTTGAAVAPPTTGTAAGTAPTTTTTVPVAYGPRPEGLVADFPEILLPLPIDPAVRQTSGSYLYIGDPLGWTLEYEGAAIDRAWCLRYFERVMAGGITKTMQFEEDGDLVFFGSNAGRGVNFVLSCEPTAQLLEVVQQGG